MTSLYIIGPVTGVPEDNRPAFEDARRRLANVGYQAEIPHSFIPAGTPHKQAMLLSISDMTSVDIRGKKIVPFYDGIALLPGNEKSQGARIEKLVAEQCGIPCKSVNEWVEETLRGDR